MSPRNIHILLEIYAFVYLKDAVYLAHDVMVGHASGVGYLERAGLISLTEGIPFDGVSNLRIGDEIPWDTTAKGDAWITAICQTPMPKPTWEVRYD